jgi:vesicular inhibitory amino acid transporter
MGDIGQRAAGPAARAAVYAIVYALDATRCVILHLAATQSLRHALGPGAGGGGLGACGGAVLVAVLALAQVRSLSRLSWFFALGTAAQVRERGGAGCGV